LIQISVVPTNLVDDYWDIALPLFSKSFEYTSTKVLPEDVYSDIMKGNQTLWIVFEEETFHVIGAFTIRVKNYPGGNALSGEHLGGERLSEWADLLFDTMERYARDLGIKNLELIGRRGWEKILKPKGWIANLVIFEKEI
jgi:hypothetical protein